MLVFLICSFPKMSVFWLLQYAPRRSFEWPIWNVVDARREGGQNKGCSNYEVDWI